MEGGGYEIVSEFVLGINRSGSLVCFAARPG